MKPDKRHETEFLPAALEIQETPPNPAGRAILWAIILFFVASVTWASLSEVDIVVVAPGKIIPVGHSKVIQPLEIGTVKAIHVEEAQTVSKGDLLIELDDAAAKADLTRVEQEIDSNGRDLKRLSSLLSWSEADAMPDEQEATALTLSQWREHRDKLAALEAEKRRYAAERRSVAAQADKYAAILPILTRKADDLKNLAHKKLASEQQYLDAEQGRLDALHNLKTQQAGMEELAENVNEVAFRIVQTKSEFKRSLTEQLDEATRRADALIQERIKAERNLAARTLTAPVDGVVQQLEVHTVGGVVTPAQQLMVVVPKGQRLEVEAFIENKDIGFVAEGQRAEIKVDAFPFTKYGTIDGTVRDISDDAIPDEQKGLLYKSRIGMKAQQLHAQNKALPLSPGMSVSVEAKTGKRYLIEYFLSPLIRYAQESNRER